MSQDSVALERHLGSCTSSIRKLERDMKVQGERIAKLESRLNADERAARLMEYAQLTFDLQKIAVLHFNKPEDELYQYADFLDIQIAVTAEEWRGFLRQFELTPAMIQLATSLKTGGIASAHPDLRRTGVIARMRNDLAAFFPKIDTQHGVSNLIDRWEKHVKLLDR